MADVLVLNATYEPVNVTSVLRALSLVMADKAEILEAHPDRVIRSPSVVLAHPIVIRLLRYVRLPRFPVRRLTRRALFARDGHRCQYCGASSNLTIDHIVPRSRGGESDWSNVVTACSPCNVRKANRLPREAGMALKAPPRPPSRALLVTRGGAVAPAWETYLAWSA